MIPRNVAEHLIRLYNRPDRYYHNIDHLAHCFYELSSVKDVDNRCALEIAIWFHDAIYNQCNEFNEEMSAALVVEELRIYSKTIIDLILATKHDKEPVTYDGKVIADIDLSIFGQSKEVFDEYEKNIELEFSYIPREEFLIGRRRALKKFLIRENIYWTDHFRNKYEKIARENLDRAFDKLTVPGGFYPEVIDLEMFNFLKDL